MRYEVSRISARPIFSSIFRFLRIRDDLPVIARLNVEAITIGYPVAKFEGCLETLVR